MRKWLPATVAAILCAIYILLNRSTNPLMLDDSDTRVLLETIRERNNPWLWFTSDWPLFNHFYRPISTLAFEFDNWAHGTNAAGYGLTNAGLVAACVALLAWFVREITNRVGFTIVCTLLFTLWHIGPLWYLPQLLMLAGLVVFCFGAHRHGMKLGAYVPVALAWIWLSYESTGITSLYSGMMGWIPGRTASVMTVFCLAALAAYARYERLNGRAKVTSEPTAVDRPATRTTIVEQAPSKLNWLWVLVAMICTALALGSYEQAVMLPACLLGVAVMFRFSGYRPRFGWQLGFWGVLFGYLALRSVILPARPSGYQLQQFRDGPGVYMSLVDYILPSAGQFNSFRIMLEQGAIMLMFAGPWFIMLRFLSDYGAIRTARYEWRLALTGYLLSIIAYLPMAWVKTFAHYHFWPMAMRTVLWTAVGAAALYATAIALSRPVRQAPIRLAPAPGSLPRR